MDNLSPEQLKAMIGMLQTMLNQASPDAEIVEETNNEDYQFTVLPTKSVKPKVRSKDRPNKFNSMPEKNMHKDDVTIDKKLRVQPPVPRARPFTMLKVVCRVCGRSEEVNPSLLSESPNRYKCNQCSTSAG